MSSRTLIGLAVALVVLAGLAALGHRSSAPDEASSETLFMPGLSAKLNNVDRIAIVGAGNKPIATIVREKSRWVVAEKDHYPADIAKVRKALIDLAEAKVVEQKTSNPDYYSRLGVEPVKLANASGTELMLKAGDKSLAAITIGHESGSNYRYVRNDANPASYLIDKSLDLPTDASKWVVPDIVDLPAKRVREVSIVRSNGEKLELTKADPKQENFTVENVPKGRELQYPAVANIVGGALHELKLQDVAAANDTKPADVTATFKTFDGLVVTVKGTETTGGDWIELAASVDQDQADAAKASASTDAKNTGKPGGTDEKADAKKAAPDPQAEADRINARVHGWRYEIATYQYNQMTRHMDDLLKPQDNKAKQDGKPKK